MAGAKPAEEAQAMMQLLLRKGLVRAADRLFKKPKPGKKRLTKWPKKLTPMPQSEQVASLSQEAYTLAIAKHHCLLDLAKPTSPASNLLLLLL